MQEIRMSNKQSLPTINKLGKEGSGKAVQISSSDFKKIFREGKINLEQSASENAWQEQPSCGISIQRRARCPQHTPSANTVWRARTHTAIPREQTEAWISSGQVLEVVGVIRNTSYFISILLILLHGVDEQVNIPLSRIWSLNLSATSVS